MQTLAVAGGKSLIVLSKWHDEQHPEDAGQGEASKAANASQRGVEGPGEGGWLTHALSTTCGWMERAGSLLGTWRLAVVLVEAAHSGAKEMSSGIDWHEATTRSAIDAPLPEINAPF